jgi:SAM-dependent methyltransferase
MTLTRLRHKAASVQLAGLATDIRDVRPRASHPVDRLGDEELREILLRADPAGFPADLNEVWKVEHGRIRETLRRIPPAYGPEARLLDLGSTRAWLPLYRIVLGYERIVLNTAYPESGFVDPAMHIRGVDAGRAQMSVYNVERDPFPHDDESVDVVLCLELLEHLAVDPMAMMAEVNRVLKPDGLFVLSTPNAVRNANLVNMILGEQPMGYVGYNGFDTNRHNRQYTPWEIDALARAAGLTPMELTTFGRKSRGSVRDILAALAATMLLALEPVRLLRGLVGASGWLPHRTGPHAAFRPRWRRDVILLTARKTSSVLDRRPAWLYFDMAERAGTSGMHAGVECPPRNADSFFDPDGAGPGSPSKSGSATMKTGWFEQTRGEAAREPRESFAAGSPPVGPRLKESDGDLGMAGVAAGRGGHPAAGAVR